MGLRWLYTLVDHPEIDPSMVGQPVSVTQPSLVASQTGLTATKTRNGTGKVTGVKVNGSCGCGCGTQFNKTVAVP